MAVKLLGHRLDGSRRALASGMQGGAIACVLGATVSLALTGSAAAFEPPKPCNQLAWAHGRDHEDCLAFYRGQLRWYARQYSVSRAEAARELYVGAALQPVVAQITAVVPAERLGPVWFLRDASQFGRPVDTNDLMVGVVDGLDFEVIANRLRDQIRRMFGDGDRAEFLVSRTEIYPVPWSHAAALTTYQDLNATLYGQPLAEATRGWGVTLKSGKEYVEITARPDASDDQFAQLQTVADRYSPIATLRRALPSESVLEAQTERLSTAITLRLTPARHRKHHTKRHVGRKNPSTSRGRSR